MKGVYDALDHQFLKMLIIAVSDDISRTNFMHHQCDFVKLLVFGEPYCFRKIFL